MNPQFSNLRQKEPKAKAREAEGGIDKYEEDTISNWTGRYKLDRSIGHNSAEDMWRLRILTHCILLSKYEAGQETIGQLKTTTGIGKAFKMIYLWWYVAGQETIGQFGNNNRQWKSLKMIYLWVSHGNKRRRSKYLEFMELAKKQRINCLLLAVFISNEAFGLRGLFWILEDLLEDDCAEGGGVRRDIPPDIPQKIKMKDILLYL